MLKCELSVLLGMKNGNFYGKIFTPITLLAWRVQIKVKKPYHYPQKGIKINTLPLNSHGWHCSGHPDG